MKNLGKISRILAGWMNNPLIEGRDFNSLFKVNDISLGWFFSSFFTESVLPSAVNPYKFVREGRPIPVISRFWFRVASLFTPKYLMMNEKRKMRKFPKVKAGSRSNKVLFLSYTNHIGKEGGVFRIQGIIDEVRKKIETRLFFVDPMSINNLHILKGRDTVYGYRNNRIEKEAWRLAGDLHKRWVGISEEDKVGAFGDIMVWDYFKSAIDMYMSRDFIFLIVYYFSLFRNMISMENGKVVVGSGIEGFFERCFFGAAVSMGVPVFIIQHGIGSEKVMSDPGLLEGMKLLVFSKKIKEEYIDKGVKKSSLVVVGPISYEDIVKYRSKSRGGNHVLIATSPLVEFQTLSKFDYFKKIEWIMNELVPDYRLTLKLHPREIYLKEYERIAKKIGKGISVFPGTVTGKNFYKLIKDSDIFIHFGSNAALEAMIIGRPILNVDMVCDKTKRIDWLEGKDIPKIKVGEDIRAEVARIQKDKSLVASYNRIIFDTVGTVDGKACKRASDMILQSFQ